MSNSLLPPPTPDHIRKTYGEEQLQVLYGVKALRPESCVVIPPLTRREIWRLRWESFKYNAIQVFLLGMASFCFAIAIHGWPF